MVIMYFKRPNSFNTFYRICKFLERDWKIARLEEFRAGNCWKFNEFLCAFEWLDSFDHDNSWPIRFQLSTIPIIIIWQQFHLGVETFKCSVALFDIHGLHCATPVQYSVGQLSHVSRETNCHAPATQFYALQFARPPGLHTDYPLILPVLS